MNLSGSVKINKCGMLILTMCVILLFYYILFSNSNIDYHRKHYAFMRNPDEINLRKLLIGGIQAAQMGGLEVVAVSRQIKADSKGKTKEGTNDLVTNADLRSHCVMQNGLQRLFPRLKIISEEDSVMKECPDTSSFELDPTVLDESTQDIIEDGKIVNVNDVTVWIDPLDATQEYTEKLFQYVTTMVCVAVRGDPIIGVIHNPFTRETIWAWKDEAVSESLRKILSSSKNFNSATSIKNPSFIVSRSHSGDVKQYIRDAFGENTPIITAAGAGYKVLQVVFNNATAYVHLTNIKKWDICAGHAILNALHGEMTTLKNEKLRYDDESASLNEKGVLASLKHHSYLAKQLLETEKAVHPT